MRRSRREYGDVEIETSDWDEPRRRRPRFRWWLLLALLALVVWSAPFVVTRPAILNKVLSWAAPQLVGRVQYDGARVGWFSAPRLQNLTILDLQDQPLLQASNIRLNRNLLQLITNPRDLGLIVIEQPSIHLVDGARGTNLQQLMDTFDTSEDPMDEEVPSTSAGTTVAVQVIDGQLVYQDLVHQHEYRIEDLDMSLDYAGDELRPSTLEIGAVTAAVPTPGRAHAMAQWQPTGKQDQDRLGAGQVQITIDGFPLGMLEPILRHLETDLQIAGLVNGTLAGHWDTTLNGPTGQVSGEFVVVDLQCASPTYLANDHIHSAETRFKLETHISNQLVDVRLVRLETDFADAEFAGTIPIPSLLARNGPGVWRMASQIESFRLAGNFDLVRLSQMLPNTMRIREGTQLTDGRVTWELATDDEGKGFHAILQSAQLAGVSQGQTISWTTPVQVSVTGRFSPHGLEIRSVRGQSGFLEFQGTGTPTAGNLAIDANLRDLTAQLGQIIDLGQYDLDGQLATQLVWQRDGVGVLQASAEIDINNLQVLSPQMAPWRESRLQVSVTTQSQLRDDRLTRVDIARMELVAADDRLAIVLTEPIMNPLDDPRANVSVRLDGDANTWIGRLSPFLALQDWRAQGHIAAEIDGEIDGTVADHLIAANSFRIDLSDLVVQGPDLTVAEPAVSIEGQAQWDDNQDQLTLSELTLRSSTLALRAEPFTCSLGNSIQADGRLAFQGDLARLWQISNQANVEAFQRPAGQLKGQLQLSMDQGRIAFHGSSTVTDMVYEVRAPNRGPLSIITVAGKSLWTPIWQEAVLKLNGQGTYDPRNDQLDLSNLVVESESVSIRAKGQIAQLLSEPNANLRGQVQYDLAIAADKLRSQLGDSIQVTGRQSQPFSIRGPLKLRSVRLEQPANLRPDAVIQTSAHSSTSIPADLSADVVLGWDSLNLFGIDVGANQVTASLIRGAVATTPVELAVSGGRVLMSPQLDLNSDPKIIAFDGQTRADNLRITPELSQSWLQYVAPWVAGAVVADGRLSVQLDRATIPVDDPAASHVQGTLTVHEARVQPGPMALQIIQMSDQISQLLQIQGELAARLKDDQWLEMSEHSVAFLMTEGRVHHDELIFHIGEVTVHSSGWVGLDQTMNLVATIPVQDDWVSRRPAFAGLRGQSIRIPIRGSINKPQFDQTALAEISRQIAGSAAQGYLNNEIQKGLQKLFGN